MATLHLRSVNERKGSCSLLFVTKAAASVSDGAAHVAVKERCSFFWGFFFPFPS